MKDGKNDKQPRRSATLCVSRKAMRTHRPPISGLMARGIQSPGLISFAAGLVDEATLPIVQVGRIGRKLFSSPARARSVLQYGTTLGLAPLGAKIFTVPMDQDGLLIAGGLNSHG